MDHLLQVFAVVYLIVDIYFSYCRHVDRRREVEEIIQRHKV